MTSNSPVSIDGIVRSPVAESSGAPLVADDPDLLGCEVEKRRRDSRAVHVILASRCHVRPVLEDSEVHGAVSAVVHPGAIHKVLSLIRDIGKVLERSPVMHRQCKRSIRCRSPLGSRWQIAVLCRDAHRSSGKQQIESTERHSDEMIDLRQLIDGSTTGSEDFELQ